MNESYDKLITRFWEVYKENDGIPISIMFQYDMNHGKSIEHFDKFIASRKPFMYLYNKYDIYGYLVAHPDIFYGMKSDRFFPLSKLKKGAYNLEDDDKVKDHLLALQEAISLKNRPSKKLVIFDEPFTLMAMTSRDRDYGNEYRFGILYKEGNLFGDTTNFYLFGHCRFDIFK